MDYSQEKYDEYIENTLKELEPDGADITAFMSPASKAAGSMLTTSAAGDFQSPADAC
jgi:hypothetical protein